MTLSWPFVLKIRCVLAQKFAISQGIVLAGLKPDGFELQPSLESYLKAGSNRTCGKKSDDFNGQQKSG